MHPMAFVGCFWIYLITVKNNRIPLQVPSILFVVVV